MSNEDRIWDALFWTAMTIACIAVFGPFIIVGWKWALAQ